MRKNIIETFTLKNVEFLHVLFFTISFIEVFAEYFENKILVYVFKPLIIPILIFLYFKTSKNVNNTFFVALFFSLVANIFFIFEDFTSIIIATVFIALSRVLILRLMIYYIKIKNFIPVIIGMIPFFIVYFYVTALTIDEIGENLILYLIQVVLICFLGGYAVANYMLDDNRKNYWLLVSNVLFAIIQFIMILKIYYISVSVFQPLIMFLYPLAQYSIYKFMILSENELLDNDTSTIGR
jgi:YhhN family